MVREEKKGMEIREDIRKGNLTLEERQEIMAVLEKVDERLQLAKEKLVRVDYQVDALTAPLKEALNQDYDFILEQLEGVKRRLKNRTEEL